MTTPLADAHAGAQVRGPADSDPSTTQRHERPAVLGGPVNWHGMHDDDLAATFAELVEFLTWAVPHWGFTTEQFPYGCWWQHTDITEEMTAWWLLWRAYVEYEHAHPADPIAFHERTHNLKQRLEATYRGRCRHGHQAPADIPTVAAPVSPLGHEE